MTMYLWIWQMAVASDLFLKQCLVMRQLCKILPQRISVSISFHFSFLLLWSNTKDAYQFVKSLEYGALTHPFKFLPLNHSILISASTKSKLPNIMFYTFVLIFGQTGGGDCNVHAVSATIIERVGTDWQFEWVTNTGGLVLRLGLRRTAWEVGGDLLCPITCANLQCSLAYWRWSDLYSTPGTCSIPGVVFVLHILWL